MVAPVLEVPLLPLPPPFMLVPVSVPDELVVLPVPLAGALIAPPEPVESAILPAWPAGDSVAGALACVLVLLSLPPQLLSDRLPSSKAVRGKKKLECRMKSKEEG